MNDTANIKILVNNSRFELDYESATDLGIKFNRVVDDLQDLGSRKGDFSYTFKLPITDINKQAFNFADTHATKRVFVNQTYDCQVLNNNKLLLEGLIELTGLQNGYFNAVFYSKFTELLDGLTGTKLNELKTFDNITSWDFEVTMHNHIDAGFANSDEADYQFPFVFYNTFHTPFSLLDTAGTDDRSRSFGEPDDDYQNHYYMLNSQKLAAVKSENSVFFHQMPLAIYMKTILEKLLESAGWSLGGSFFDRADMKKIIMLYTGDNDVYDRARVLAADSESGTIELRLEEFLPDMDGIEFIKGLINTFNLYFFIDTKQRSISFETYNTLFNTTTNPYNITDKVDHSTAVFSRIEDYDPSVTFKVGSSANQRIDGDSQILTDNTDLSTGTFAKGTDEHFSNVFNKQGLTQGTISVPFGEPAIKKFILRNDYNFAGADLIAGDWNVFVPNISKQSPTDNANKKFFKKESHSTLFNTEDLMTHTGSPTLMFYYGVSQNDHIPKVGKGFAKDFMYVNMPENASNSNLRLPYCSPFQYKSKESRGNIEDYLTLINGDFGTYGKTRLAAEATYLQGLFFNMGTIASNEELETEFSLTFSDDDTLHDTLYTKFHRPKYSRYKDSELLSAVMQMSSVDWDEMQINRCIEYNNEYYHIVSIENYDPVLGISNINLIKVL